MKKDIDINSIPAELRTYTLPEVSVMTGLCVRTLRGYCRSGKLRARAVGKCYRVTYDAIKEFNNQECLPMPRNRKGNSIADRMKKAKQEREAKNDSNAK